MEGSTSLINIGELSKPATVLVEKISDAVGGIFKPYQIVRVAKAEAQADRVRAEGQIEISDLQRRAFHRFLQEEGKKQKTIEDITQKALPLLNEHSKPNELEDDWITHFFDRCRLISDDQMQSLWSRILAGEANSPGHYSKRTLSVLSDLDQSDSQLFTQLCSLGWKIDGFTPLIYGKTDRIHNLYNINPRAISHLQTIGLIQYDANGFNRKVSTGFASHSLYVEYFKKRIVLLLSDTEIDFPIGSDLDQGR